MEESDRDLKRTVLYPLYEKYGGKVVDYAGWELPVEFSGLSMEHEAVRTRAGLFDVSHMGEIEVKGKEGTAFLEKLMTNNVGAMTDNQVIYTFMCYEDGGVVDDLLIYKYGDKEYLLVVNASNADKDFLWMKDHMTGYDVEISNISGDISELALQGPKAETILQKLTDENLSSLGPFHLIRNVEAGGFKCLISRTGYTGEDGFEIYMSNKDCPIIWEKIMEAGKNEGLLAAGLGARDTLRFEVALPLYGNEISQEISPIEAGFGFFVKFDKGDYIGRQALLKQKEEGPKRKLVGFEMVENGIPRHGYPVFDEEEEIGFVTTGYHSPSLVKNIGFALIKADKALMGEEIEIQIRKKRAKAKIVDKRFYKKNYKK